MSLLPPVPASPRCRWSHGLSRAKPKYSARPEKHKSIQSTKHSKLDILHSHVYIVHFQSHIFYLIMLDIQFIEVYSAVLAAWCWVLTLRVHCQVLQPCTQYLAQLKTAAPFPETRTEHRLGNALGNKLFRNRLMISQPPLEKIP